MLRVQDDSDGEIWGTQSGLTRKRDFTVDRTYATSRQNRCEPQIVGKGRAIGY